MKKLLLILLIIAFGKVHGDDPPQDSTEFHCSFDQLLDSMMLDPEYVAFQKRLDFYIKQYKQQGMFLPEFEKPMPFDIEPMSGECDSCFGTKSLYLIPLVVHVFHLPSDSVAGMGSNISIAQVHNAIFELNKSFSAFGYTDTNAFNTGIQFYLAPVGPDSNGILRYSTVLSDHELYEYDKLWALVDSFYNPNRFVNIFTTNKNINPNNPDAIHAGYATLPHKSDNALVVQHNWFGNYLCINEPVDEFSRGKTLAHEMGHYLDLFHTFHEGCTEDTSGSCETKGDRCCDTPPVNNQKGNNDCDITKYMCPSSSTPTQPGNCMDYTPDRFTCGFWFTRNQTERMHAALQLMRKGLINIDSINNWGVSHCGLAVDFKGKQNILCDPDTTTLTALRYVDAVQYRWKIHNSQTTLLDTSGTGLYKIKFPLSNIDTFDVTLTLIRGTETAELTRNNYVMLRKCIPLEDTRARWYFGDNAGLLFTEDGVVPDLGAYNSGTTGTIDIGEGNLSLSDSSGNLLFYGGPFTINTSQLYQIDSTNKHVPIIRDNGLHGRLKIRYRSSQPLIAIPHPNNPERFIIFQNNGFMTAMLSTTPGSRITHRGGLYYSELYKNEFNMWVVDSTKHQVPVKGLPGVPIVRDDDDSAILIREYMTAIPKCDNNGYWLIVAADNDPDSVAGEYNSGKLLFLSVDTDGITLNDTLTIPEFNSGTYFGQIKFSPDGSMFAMFKHLFDFDRLQGNATIRHKISEWSFYGFSFSNNSRNLYYISHQTDENIIYQLSLDVDPPNPVEVGKHDMGYPSNRAAMQLAPNNKIYISNFDEALNESTPYISVINNPDTVIGNNTQNIVGFEKWTVPLQLSGVGGGGMDGFPNFVEAAQYHKGITSMSYTRDSCATFKFRANSFCASDYKWYFGDGDSAEGKTAIHQYNPGTYLVTLIAGTDTINETINFQTLSVQISGPDTICPKSSGFTYSMVLTNDTLNSWDKYKWKVFNGTIQDSTNELTNVNIQGDIATLIGSVMNEATGCEATDTFIITRFTDLANNIINNGNPLFVYCPNDTGLYTIPGSLPTGGDSTYYYSWTILKTNGTLHSIQDSQNLILSASGFDTLFATRMVYSDGCEDWSDTIMIVPKIRENIINNGSDTLIIFDYVTQNPLIILGDTVKGSDSIAYQWYYSTDSTDWQPITGQEFVELEHDSFSGFRWFYRLASIDDCGLKSNVVKVYPTLWNNQIGDTSVNYYCANDNIQIDGSYPVGGNDAYTYQWFISTNGSSWSKLENETSRDLDINGYYTARYFKRRAYSGLDSTESNVIQFIPNILNNTITYHYNDYIVYVCANYINIFSNTGSTPNIHQGTPSYQWYYAADSMNFEPISGKTLKDLSMEAEDSIIFIYRKVLISGCESNSNIVKLIPMVKSNKIFADPCYNGTELNISGDYFPYIYSPNQSIFANTKLEWLRYYYYPFQKDTILELSDSFKAKSVVYSDNIDTFLLFKRVYYVTFFSSSGDYNCYHFSNEIKVYNPDYLKDIEIREDGSNIIIASKVESPEGTYSVTWQKKCSIDDWEDISGSISDDILGDSSSYTCCQIRRRLIPLDNQGAPLDCDTFYSNILSNGADYFSITSHPNTYQTSGLHDSANFEVAHNGSGVTQVQWQISIDGGENWTDIAGANDLNYKVSGDACNDDFQFRAKVFNECQTEFSDPATLIVTPGAGSDYFLWLRDLPSDTAAEPNYQLHSTNYLFSPDIQPSHNFSPTVMVNPKYYVIGTFSTSASIYIHTKIRNKGTDTSQGGKLYLYATQTGLHPEWTFSFTKELQFIQFGPSILLSNHNRGTEINETGINIPPIPPGGETWVTYHWTGAPSHFIGNNIRLWSNEYMFDNSKVLIYLARIETCENEPYGMTYPEVKYNPSTYRTAFQNIRNNARIAALHSELTPMKPQRDAQNVLDRMPDKWNTVEADPYNRPYKLVMNSDSIKNYFDDGEVYIYFDDNMWDAWINGGSRGTGFVVVEDNVFKINALQPVYWDSMTLAPDSTGYIGYSLHYKPAAPMTGGMQHEFFRFSLHVDTFELGEFWLHTEIQTGMEGSAFNGDDDTDNTNESTSLIETQTTPLVFSARPNPFSNELKVFVANFEHGSSVTMFDMNGKHLFSQSLDNNNTEQVLTFQTAHLSEGVYYVHYRSQNQNMVRKIVLVR